MNPTIENPIPASIPDSPAAGSQLWRWVDAVFSRLTRFQRAGVLIAVGLQLAALCGMIVQQMIPHTTGTAVWLKVVPVDPRDMFRGDYVILSYPMSRNPGDSPAIAQGSERESESAIYVTLVPDADGIHHRADQYLRDRPASGLYLTGKMAHWGRIEYGLESFYVQSGTGGRYEEAARKGTLSARVMVSPDGQAGLKRLSTNPAGEPPE